MREILFRGKRCDNGEWVQGYYIRADHHWHKYGIHKGWIACGASANGGWFALHNKYAVNDETVGQFTGLTDKNGKQIFEGDIVKADNGHISEVTFHFGAFCCYCQCHDTHNTLWSDILTVIGNVHDNPELLEK